VKNSSKGELDEVPTTATTQELAGEYFPTITQESIKYLTDAT
jgi:hypothetical protein